MGHEQGSVNSKNATWFMNETRESSRRCASARCSASLARSSHDVELDESFQALYGRPPETTPGASKVSETPLRALPKRRALVLWAHRAQPLLAHLALRVRGAAHLHA